MSKGDEKTPHNHRQTVPGCFRCDLDDDEMGRERALLDAAKEVMVTSRAVITYNQAVRLLAAIRLYEAAWEPSQAGYR